MMRAPSAEKDASSLLREAPQHTDTRFQPVSVSDDSFETLLIDRVLEVVSSKGKILCNIYS